jgi:hypothetical protein
MKYPIGCCESTIAARREQVVVVVAQMQIDDLMEEPTYLEVATVWSHSVRSTKEKTGREVMAE